MPEQELVQTEGWRCPVRFELWPAQSLRCSLLVIGYGSRRLANSVWVWAVRRDLDFDLRSDITILNELDFLRGLMVLQLERGLTSMAIPDFIAWMAGLPPTESVLNMEESPHVPALDPDGAWYRAVDPEGAPDGEPVRRELTERIRHLISAPGDLRDLAAETRTTFWHRPPGLGLRPPIPGRGRRNDRVGRSIVLMKGR